MQDGSGFLLVLLCLALSSAEEELAPVCPVAVPGDREETVVIFIPVRFKERADIKHGGGNQSHLLQKQRDEHPPQAAIAIQERV